MEYILEKYRSIFLKNIRIYIKDNEYQKKNILQNVKMDTISINNNNFFTTNNKLYDRKHYHSNIYIYHIIGKIINNNLIIWNKI
jgi:hypothetical protein